MGVALQSCSRVDLVLFFIAGDLVMGEKGEKKRSIFH
jgi:hypothetical protein